MILVIGASGMLGNALCKILPQDGYRLKAVTRNPDDFDKNAYPSIEVVYGDLANPETLKNHFKKVNIVIACAHSLLGKGKNDSAKIDNEGHKKLIELCVENKVEQFIYTSIYGASADSKIDFMRTKYDIEQYLIQSGLPYTIIRPTAFMELHAHKFLGESILTKGKVKIFGHGKNLYNYVAVNDVAKLIALALKEKITNKILEIGSKTNITRTEVAKLYAKQTGKEVRISYVSPKKLRILSKVIKPFHKGISRVMHMSAVMDETDYTFDHENNKIPFEMTSIDDFIAEQAWNFTTNNSHI
jgi:uncharacterized protein YbjT (DUF2867 family)